MRRSKKPAVIILHGWGLCGNVYKKFAHYLENEGFLVFSPDLPGFGVAPLINESMTLSDYVDFVHHYIKMSNIENPAIIGHSFGGRVAVKYIHSYPESVTKLVLTGVPVIRNKSLSKWLAYVLAVFGGKFFEAFPREIREFFRKLLYFMIGEWDYYKAGKLKRVFENIVNEDLVSYVRKINIPILLVWGSDDRIVPLSDGRKILKLIPKAKLVVVASVGHKLPYQNPKALFEACLPFLKTL